MTGLLKGYDILTDMDLSRFAFAMSVSRLLRFTRMASRNDNIYIFNRILLRVHTVNTKTDKTNLVYYRECITVLLKAATTW